MSNKRFKDSSTKFPYSTPRVKSQKPNFFSHVQRQESNTEFNLESTEKTKYNPNTRNMSKVVREEVINGKRFFVISTN